jgi:hypothetical protein
VRAEVPAGARALLTYEQGDPRRPVAALWELGSVTSLFVNASERRVARTDDATGNGSITFAVAANTPSLGLTTLTVAYAPPSGPPQSVGVVLTGAATLAPGPVSLALSGAITGSSILRA